MSSEMRELIRKEVEQWVGITRNRDIERSARVWMEGYDAALTYCAERISALLARTEAGADGAIYQMMATDEDVDEDGNVRPDDPRMWMDHSREEYERLNNHPSVRSRIVYTHPQDASGDAVDWKWQYRFQTVMRFMDNGATREAAERAALIDIAALESAAMQAKEAK